MKHCDWKTVCSVFLLWAASATILRAQSFINLVNFDATNGANPQSSIIQDTDGNYYGTVRFGGGLGESICGYPGCGTLFRLTPEGALTVLYDFCSQASCADGAEPGDLMLSSNGNMYGTTEIGGTGAYCTIKGGCGTVFSITPAGKLTTVYSFCSQANCSDGYVGWMISGLIQATNGNLYGTTYGGGANGYGTVFEMTPADNLTTLYSFCSKTNCADGSYALDALVQGSDGNFYGTTNGGGDGAYCATASLPCGTVFKITSTGKLTTLYSFCDLENCADGETPYGSLVQGRDGSFYGTTYAGGANAGGGNISCPGNCGTVFRITPGGKLTTLYSFCSQTDCTDGLGPWAGLSLGTDGNFYGTTGYGGSTANGATYGSGTIFKVTPAGVLTVLDNFDVTDGSGPAAQLVQATNGSFYGTAVYGGAFPCYNPPVGCGTAFNLSVGLSPFVETNPASGKVGSKTTILGNNLEGATSVTFNGTTAAFEASRTNITTTVPAGATTGTVEVTIGERTLKTKVSFIVTP
jgi:uncharacterized repeat protein (TIGR03803 family)